MRSHYNNTTKKMNVQIVDADTYRRIVPHAKHADDTFGFARKNKGKIVVKRASTDRETMDRLSHEMHEIAASSSAHSLDGVRYGFFSGISDWFQEKVFNPIKDVLDPIRPEQGAKWPMFLGGGLGGGMFTKGKTIPNVKEFVRDITPREVKKALPDILTAVGYYFGGPVGAGVGRAGGKVLSQELQDETVGGRQTLEAGLKGYGYGGLANIGVGAVQGGTAADPGFWSKASGIGKGALKGAGLDISHNLTLPGFGEGGMFAGSTGGAGGAGGAGGTSYLQGGNLLYGGADPALSSIGAGLPGGNLLTTAGSSGGGGILSNLLSSFTGGAGGDTNWLMKLLPTLLMGGAYLGQEAPEMPAFQPAPEVGMASQTYQDLLNQIQSQDFMTPIQDYLNLQQEQSMRNLRTQAGQQGWLDSSMFAEREADIGRQYGVAGGLSMADLAKWGIGQSGNIAEQLGNIGQYLTGAPYEAEMGRYNTEEASRQALLQSIFSQLGNVFNPNPMDEYLRKMLAGR